MFVAVFVVVALRVCCCVCGYVCDCVCVREFVVVFGGLLMCLWF